MIVQTSEKITIRGIAEVRNFGKIHIIVRKKMDENHISIYKMSQLTNLRHQTIKSYYYNDPISRVDMEVLAKICYVLNCKIEDVLEYESPNE